ncbi:MAG: hypothetical protein JRI68_04830 [Deltaproteobacteria bacterium]|nr:hypothetical protein [Deltaproteobacteria bacterium]
MASLALACGAEGPDDGMGGDYGPGPGASSGTGGSTTTTSTDDDLGGSSSSSSSSSSSTSSTGSSSTSSTSSTGSSGGDNLCEPDPNDDLCIACAKTQCCYVLDSCAQDPDCQCWIDCLAQQSVGVCYGQCGLPMGVGEQLFGCMSQGCATDCGF